MMPRVPHLHVVVLVSLIAILGYGGFSIWVLGYTTDAALKGDVVGTWKSFAVLGFGFWLGSSSGGKAKSEDPSRRDDAPIPPDAPAPRPRTIIPEVEIGKEP